MNRIQKQHKLFIYLRKSADKDISLTKKHVLKLKNMPNNPCFYVIF